ncbi:MAG TPA: DEAD/DEAH box helicase family protein, partial [Brevibacterium sp.]|nr:DEAD/DEAH box helicase family protein [Brevibacterium sp.]
FDATFETYWNDPSYVAYSPDDDANRLDAALSAASGRTAGQTSLNLSGLEVRPFSYQQEILEQLEVERAVHDRHRNLVVAATGTGKTVVAALDYRNLMAGSAEPPQLLFVAHRIEILQQALRTYREVLADGSFGELMGQGYRPKDGRHVFGTIQSITRVLDDLPPDEFDVVVIDEFHHAHAATYRRLLDHLTPRELLGLTATPERADGVDVTEEFFGGRTAAELRLWDALEAELLSPFHYFGIADNVDLRSVSWKRGRYDQAELENVFTGNDARARIILKQLQDKVGDVHGMRALGFCAGVRHAQYMADTFDAAGIPARAVSGDTPADEREQALRDLRARRVNILFAADLYNEGL